MIVTVIEWQVERSPPRRRGKSAFDYTGGKHEWGERREKWEYQHELCWATQTDRRMRDTTQLHRQKEADALHGHICKQKELQTISQQESTEISTETNKVTNTGGISVAQYIANTANSSYSTEERQQLHSSVGVKMHKPNDRCILTKERKMATTGSTKPCVLSQKPELHWQQFHLVHSWRVRVEKVCAKGYQNITTKNQRIWEMRSFKRLSCRPLRQLLIHVHDTQHLTLTALNSDWSIECFDTCTLDVRESNHSSVTESDKPAHTQWCLIHLICRFRSLAHCGMGSVLHCVFSCSSCSFLLSFPPLPLHCILLSSFSFLLSVPLSNAATSSYAQTSFSTQQPETTH